MISESDIGQNDCWQKIIKLQKNYANTTHMGLYRCWNSWIF